ncbi:MAG: hypothetical protein JST29_05045 [Bacteroidetes bacterium]|nr:hypothetical protein [Bacteroidota bacterium]
MRSVLFLILFFTAYKIQSQCVTYRITENGDTLNCKDKNNFKQGKWTIHIDEIRGEPGYEEEGIFKDDKREGKWRRFNLMGDLIAVENYRWGFKDGLQQYFYMNAIEHEERWLAMDPKKKYDTINMPDLYDPDKNITKIIKVEGYSMRNGVWKYYQPGSMNLVRTETYVFDSLYTPKPEKVVKQTSTIPVVKDSAVADPSAKKIKPKEVLEFEKKNARKKKADIRDGKTSGP